jgi:hypothetical protein
MSSATSRFSRLAIAPMITGNIVHVRGRWRYHAPNAEIQGAWITSNRLRSAGCNAAPITNIHPLFESLSGFY